MKQLAANIYIGKNLCNDSAIFAIKDSRVLIVTQKNIYTHHANYIDSLKLQFTADIYFLPQDEVNKTLVEWQKLLDFMCEKGFDRSVVLIAIGGGFVGDITGFAASCFMRGVTFLQMPTTLLAQADSAIGGKNGVNHAFGKNLIGTFYQPHATYIDSIFLTTLPTREYHAGLAEIIKYGLIHDASLFAWLEQNIEGLLNRDDELIRYAIEQSVQIKLNIVRQDEKDHGVRNLLNFGHTFAHALEKIFSYQKLLHGEAVNIGMQMASSLSREFGLSDSAHGRIKKLLRRIMPQPLEAISASQMVQLMKKDKKSSSNKIKLILLKDIGSALITDDVSEDKIVQVIAHYE